MTSPGPSPCGVLVVDKPQGLTSHDVVARIRKALKTREVGHAGTLDPMATGVLVLAVGEATKLVPYLTAADKEYQTRIALGVTTNSLDADGTPTEVVPVPAQVIEALTVFGATRASQGILEEALAHERARSEQVPPAVSAIKVDGQRAHQLVRQGTVPTLPPRPISVRHLDMMSAGGGREPDSMPWLELRVGSSKGYYVRSLARDLASSLGTVGHLVALRRVRSGTFGESEALSVDSPPETLKAALIPLATAALRCLSHCTLDDAAVLAAYQGKKVPLPSTVRLLEPMAWLDGQGSLVAIGQACEGTAPPWGRVLRGFRPTTS